jgi:integrase/recombinase XerD
MPRVIRRGPGRSGSPAHPTGKRPRPARSVPLASNLLAGYQAAFHEWEEIAGYSSHTIAHQRFAIARFIAWCAERGLDRPQDITRPILERYQRHVYHHRKPNGQPLSVTAQLGLILPLQAWFKWMTKQNHLLYNPAADLDLPRKPKTLPKGLLSVAEVESVLNATDVGTSEGVRARAILETLYSTGIRRMEVVNLKLYDVDTERGALMVRLGKGAKDRLVPIGARACAWVAKYRDEVRPVLAAGPAEQTLFLDDDGQVFDPGKLGELVKRYLMAAGIAQPGACHLFRHACATHMLENGADIRFIQAMFETSTYCPPTANRGSDLVSVSSAMRRDGARFQAIRLPWRRSRRDSAARWLDRLHSGMDDQGACLALRGDPRAAVFT